jgi:hypothetical protein
MIVLILTNWEQQLISKSKMCVDRKRLARVALGIGTEDDLYLVDRYRRKHQICTSVLTSLIDAAQKAASLTCLDEHELIECADTGKMSQDQQDHIYDCPRCARIGQIIANLPMDRRDHVSMVDNRYALSA